MLRGQRASQDREVLEVLADKIHKWWVCKTAEHLVQQEGTAKSSKVVWA